MTNRALTKCITHLCKSIKTKQSCERVMDVKWTDCCFNAKSYSVTNVHLLNHTLQLLISETASSAPQKYPLLRSWLSCLTCCITVNTKHLAFMSLSVMLSDITSSWKKQVHGLNSSINKLRIRKKSGNKADGTNYVYTQ